MKKIADEQLVVDYLQGDRDALSFLVERYLRQIYNFTARYIGNTKEAEDLTQEIFLKVWKSLKKFNSQKSFKTWLFSIARNVCIDYLRRKKIVTFSDLENDNDDESFSDKIADESISVIEKITRQELEREMGKYLLRLSEANRSVLILHYSQQMAFREISEMLGESLDTVKSRHRRALNYLRRFIEQEGKMHQKQAVKRIYNHKD